MGAPSRADHRGPSPVGSGYALKRLLLGRPIVTARLEHERLGKPTALAVFASDNLSSTAYATEEILRVLVPAVGILAFTYVLPISLAVIVVEAILIFSYRQTIKAYPTAGGAYVVTRDNFGMLPAQVAGVSLLIDYVLTVAVSVAAGVQALSSVWPAAHAYRVPIALGFVWLIAYGNLLGVRESGKLFGVPTYVFVASLLTTIAVGAYRVLTGHVEPVAVTQEGTSLSFGTAAVTAFLVLRAFASGGAAVTGVEAISNGVTAFRKPEWRNAQTTLMWMGAILATGFLGISFLATRLHVVPVADESESVLAQIGRAVYGTGTVGHTLFLLLQGSTMLILVLAANTSFADFPRLASFQAGDSFLPRQFTKRGHRLVFSSGIVALAAAASVLLVAFGASVAALIPLYALGVFTSFTLSQSGMARRHLRVREPRWPLGFAINALGALATGVVTAVIAIVKFTAGAWMVVVAAAFLVWVLVRVNRTYEAEERQLIGGLEAGSRARRRHVGVLLVDDVDEKTLHALQYALTIRPQELHAIHLVTDAEHAREVGDAWADVGTRVPLEMVACGGERTARVADHVRIHATQDAEVTLIVPGPARMGVLERLRRGRSWSALVHLMDELPNLRLVVVRDHGGPGHTIPGEQIRVSPRALHRVLILAERLDRSVVEAVAYARAIEAIDVRVLHVAVDRTAAAHLLEQWASFGPFLGVPLEAEDCPDRAVDRAVKAYVEHLQAPDTEISVILPRRAYPHLLQRLLHDRTSRQIARALQAEPHVDVVVVPYRLHALGEPGASADVRNSRPAIEPAPSLRSAAHR